jgi:uncharacterized protein
MIFRKKLTLVILLLAFNSGISAQKCADNKAYVSSVKKERNEKDKEFLNETDSPLDSLKKQKFRELNYYRIDPKWKVTARLETYPDPDTIKMRTTTERLPLYLVYGKAYFTVQGEEYALTIYRNVGLMSKPGYEDYLFVPFRDVTSGIKSYEGGRYIDARIIEGDQIIIDFNKAYNPYCVYSKKYSCPIPPSENYLELMVKAGEKNYQH